MANVYSNTFTFILKFLSKKYKNSKENDQLSAFCKYYPAQYLKQC